MELSAISRNPLGAPASLLSTLRSYHHLQVDKHFHRREKTSAIPASLEPSMSIPQSICVGIELEFMVALQIPNSDAMTGETRWTCPTTPEAFLGLVMGDYKDIEPSCIHKVAGSPSRVASHLRHPALPKSLALQFFRSQIIAETFELGITSLLADQCLRLIFGSLFRSVTSPETALVSPE